MLLTNFIRRTINDISSALKEIDGYTAQMPDEIEFDIAFTDQFVQAPDSSWHAKIADSNSPRIKFKIRIAPILKEIIKLEERK